jgi:sugar lactone lactonase YvrE
MARGHVLGDVTLGPDGEVFVSDSNQPAFYRLHPAGDLVPTTSAFFNSPQGIAAAPDGKTLFLADYSLGIMRVDLGTGAIDHLEDAPHSTSLGVDGLLYHDHALIGVQNGVSPARIVRFALDESEQRIVRVDVLDRLDGEPTAGTMVGNRFVYVGTSQWDLHADDGRVKPGAVLPPAVLLGIVIR